MKILITTTLVAITLLSADIASAKPRDISEPRSDRHYTDQHYTDQQYRKRHHQRQRQQKSDLVRLDLPVHVRGDDRIHLRRLIRNHGYNPNHYTLRKVVFNNKSHRRASARLRVGNRVAFEHLYGPGKTQMRAPAQTNGRWVLALDNARVNSVRVVLEPKNNWAYYRGPEHSEKRWFNDRRGRS